MTICCLGDLVLDVIVRLEQPLATGADATSRIVLRPGGQAANVAAWVAALGGSSRFVGKRGADDAGALAASRLRELGVELLGPGRADRERRHRLARRPVRRAHDVPRPRRRRRAPPRGDRRGVVRGLHHLHVSGYALLREPVRFAAAARDRARARAAALGSASTSRRGARSATSARERFRAQLEELAPDVVFANEEEDEIVGGPIDGVDLDPQAGRRGRVVRRRRASPRVPVESIVDTTGAGDAFAAGWLVGGPELALEAGAALRAARRIDAGRRRSARLAE